MEFNNYILYISGGVLAMIFIIATVLYVNSRMTFNMTREEYDNANLHRTLSIILFISFICGLGFLIYNVIDNNKLKANMCSSEQCSTCQ